MEGILKVKNSIIWGVILLPLCIVSAEGWQKEEGWVNKGWFFDSNYLEDAQKAHTKGNYKAAAKYYEEVFQNSIVSKNKAKALFEKGLNYELAQKQYSAYEAYRELITRYTNAEYYNNALNRMIAIGDAFKEKESTLFSNNHEKALDVYSSVLSVAPYSQQAPAVALSAATLEASGLGREKAIILYQKIIKQYKHSREEVILSHLNLAKIYESKMNKADHDTVIATRGQELMEEFIQKYPKSKMVTEGKKMKTTFENYIAMYNYNLGYFYTWEANLCIPAARRYLHTTLLKYPDSPAAVKAEKLLASIDPDYLKTDRDLLQNNEEAMELPLSFTAKRELTPLQKAKDPTTWEPETFVIEHPERTDKWLTPVPNIKGAK